MSRVLAVMPVAAPDPVCVSGVDVCAVRPDIARKSTGNLLLLRLDLPVRHARKFFARGHGTVAGRSKLSLQPPPPKYRALLRHERG